jgi:hypothetical protein
MRQCAQYVEIFSQIKRMSDILYFYKTQYVITNFKVLRIKEAAVRNGNQLSARDKETIVSLEFEADMWAVSYANMSGGIQIGLDH